LFGVGGMRKRGRKAKAKAKAKERPAGDRIGK
jgi:hypothetical protein